MADDDHIEDASDPGVTDSSSASPSAPLDAATIDAPQENAAGTELKLEARSVKTVSHAWNICKATEYSNRTRAARTADIQSIHDGAPPRSASDQAEKAKAWQANASTNWLAGIVGRQSQRFVNAIISQLYLTYSRLPDSHNEAKRKSDYMQAKFTRLVRSWSGYTGLTNSLAVETVLQGYTYGVFLDPYTWKPRMFKQDRFFVPEESGQHAREIQFCVAKMDYRLDEFLDLIKDESAAKDVGYDLDNCMEAASKAVMQDPREDALTTQFRKWVDMINEGVLGLSYTNTGARVVNVWLLFNREYDGKVSFWLISRDSGKLLRFSFKLFEKMDDVMAMFSFEPGNGCIHSSKGLGRKLAPLAVMKELFRCGIIDNGRMSGLMIMQIDSKDRNRLAPQILSPFIMVDANIKIPTTQFTANGESYKEVDQMIDNWAEQAVGAYITSQLEDRTPDKTATQVTIESKREQEAADIQIRRWLDQYFVMVQIMQGRAFSDEAIKVARRIFKKIAEDPTANERDIYEDHGENDAEVIRTLVEIMQFLQITDEEIEIWRDSPASVFAHVSDAVIQQGINAVFQLFKGDPAVDQGKLKSKVIEGMVGARDAQDLLIPMPDQTSIAQATNEQLLEANFMTSTSQPIPVVATQNHLFHGTVVQQLLATKVAPALSTAAGADPKTITSAGLLLNHLADHLNMMAQLGQNNSPQFSELEKFFQGFKKQLTEVVQIQAEAKVHAAAVAHKISTEGLPPQGAGSPPAEVAPVEAPPQGTTAPGLTPGGTVPTLSNTGVQPDQQEAA